MKRSKLSRLLIDIRATLGMTQQELAADIGVVQGTIATWERGAGYPTAVNFVRLRKFLQEKNLSRHLHDLVKLENAA